LDTREKAASRESVAADIPVRAFRSVSAVALTALLTVAALAADLGSKHAVFASLLNDPDLQARAAAYARIVGDQANAEQALHQYSRPVIPGVRFTLSTNPNIAFGWPVFRWLVTAATVATLGLVIYFFAVSPARARLMHVALALILGGALGNLYDRLLGVVSVPGYEPIRRQVRDFVDCADLYYPYVFNVADAWLVIGVGLLAIHWWRSGRATKNDTTQRGSM